MEREKHLAALRREGALFAAAAERTEFGAPIPPCPEWCMRDLVRHLGGVHRWATTIVVERRAEPPGPAEEDAFFGNAPGDEALIDWFRAGHAALVDALHSAPADVVCWYFLTAPSPLAFWSRRQAHETAMHRVDMERAAGIVTPFPPDFAADGIDEILLCFASRPGGRLRSETPRSLCLQAVDADRAWLVRILPEGIDVQLKAGDADCTVRAGASDLHLLLWNRRASGGLDVQGDSGLLDLWRESVRIRWA